MQDVEILVCGGGIIGLTLARELVSRGADKVLIIDKEPALGRHASGRNSGVLHAGIYYPKGSLKARLCLRGNRLMKAYCQSKGLPLRETGKVIVAREESEVSVIQNLYTTASDNGATVELLDAKALETWEPFAQTCRVALRSADTAIVNPQTIVWRLAQDLHETGRVRILTSTAFSGLKKVNVAETSMGPIQFRLFVNTAGAYSDRIAHEFGLAHQFRLIPFKGTYRKLRKEKASLIKGNIYPVPDLRNPFLGVHFTRSIHDEVYVGPTAIPAFGRENYRPLEQLNRESFRILRDDVQLFFLNRKFRTVALSEPRKYLPHFFYQDAKSLVKALEPEDLEPSDKVGIRPQLVDWGKKELVMDFLVQKTDSSLHILNAISPAFTSSMAFAEYVASEYLA